MSNLTLFALATVVTSLVRTGCDGSDPHLSDGPTSGQVECNGPCLAVCSSGKRVGDGTLIAPLWVIAPGHLAESSDRSSRGRLEVCYSNGRSCAVSAVHLHPDYAPEGPNDVALLQLERPVARSDQGLGDHSFPDGQGSGDGPELACADSEERNACAARYQDWIDRVIHDPGSALR